MKYDYTPYINLPYVFPHGCLLIIARIYRELYGWDIDKYYDVHANEGIAAMQDALVEHLQEIGAGNEQEGDIILIRAWPWHVALVIEPGLMLHALEGRHSIVSDYHKAQWKNRVRRYFRYVG